MIPTGLVDMANTAFAKDAASTPSITLRAGEALDRYDDPAPFDPAIDEVADTYLVQYSGGLTFLDAESWRFLGFLAFSESSAHQGFACQVLDEGWIPGALYRERAE